MNISWFKLTRTMNRHTSGRFHANSCFLNRGLEEDRLVTLNLPNHNLVKLFQNHFQLNRTIHSTSLHRSLE